jgi:hypothetical protein
VQLLDGRLVLSATDLSNHLVCRHLTSLDLAVAHGLAKVPPSNDPRREALQARGLEHEIRYLASFEAQGLRVENLAHLRGPPAVEATLEAMRKGLDIIAQGTLLVVSGVYYPVSVLPDWMQFLAKFSPATYALEGIRQAILEGQGVTEMSDQIVPLILIGVVSIPLGLWVFRRGELYAKKHGKLKRSG